MAFSRSLESQKLGERRAASGPRSYKDMGNGGVLECWHDSEHSQSFVRTGLQRAANLLFQQYQSTYSPLENYRLQNCGVDHPTSLAGDRVDDVVVTQKNLLASYFLDTI